MTKPPLSSLVNTFEFEALARQLQPLELYDAIAGSDRRPFDHITLRPRMMVDTTKLDLRRTLFGTELIAPIIANSPADPAARPSRYHLQGDQAFAEATAAARTIAIVNDPVDRVDAWRRVTNATQARAARAQALVTPHASLSAVRKASQLPVIAEDITSVNDATRAIANGADALLLSRPPKSRAAHPMETLAAVVDKARATPVLIGGEFRRGTDILMALALGAAAVRITRPAIWALASYETAGVTAILELLQTELARNMAMAGKPSLAALDRTVLTIHKP